jgi:hypothetical protein
MRMEPWGRKARTIMAVKSTAIREEEMVVCLQAIRDE